MLFDFFNLVNHRGSVALYVCLFSFLYPFSFFKVAQNEVDNFNVQEICGPGAINQAFSRFDFMPRTIVDEQTVAVSVTTL